MSLLKTRRFLPLFVTQCMGALNDNLLKNALVMLVTYRLAAGSGENAQVLVALAGRSSFCRISCFRPCRDNAPISSTARA